MFMAIMEVPGVYQIKQETRGLVTYTWYDVTDYEGHTTGSRRYLSPIWLIAFMDGQFLGSKNHARLNSCNYLMQWCQGNFRKNLPFIVVLFFVRLLYIVCSFLFDMDTSFYDDYVPGNTTNHCRPDFAIVLNHNTRLGLSIYLTVHSCIIVIIHIIETIISRSKRNWAIWNTMKGKKNIVAHVTVYRSANLIFAIFIIAYMTCAYLKLQESVTYFLDISRMVCPMLSIWSMLYFIQLLPSIGHFVIGVQQIINVMFHFVLIYSLMMIPFMHSFQLIINTKTNVGCIDGFSTVFDVGYSLFSTMLNMVDFRSIDMRNVRILLFAHVVFTFLISIMMINFFIALLSNTVSLVDSHRKSAIIRQRITVSFLIESRLAWLCSGLYRRLNPLKVEDGKILLVDVKYDTCSEKM